MSSIENFHNTDEEIRTKMRLSIMSGLDMFF